MQEGGAKFSTADDAADGIRNKIDDIKSNRMDVDPSKIILWGYSNGALASLIAASGRDDIFAVAATSPPLFNEDFGQADYSKMSGLYTNVIYVYGTPDDYTNQKTADGVIQIVTSRGKVGEAKKIEGAGHGTCTPENIKYEINFIGNLQKRPDGVGCNPNDGADPFCASGWCDNQVCVPDSTYCGDKATGTWSKSLTVGSWVCKDGIWSEQAVSSGEKKVNGASCGLPDGADTNCLSGWCDNKVCVPDNTFCGNKDTMTWSKELTIGSWSCSNGDWRELSSVDNLFKKSLDVVKLFT